MDFDQQKWWTRWSQVWMFMLLLLPSCRVFGQVVPTDEHPLFPAKPSTGISSNLLHKTKEIRELPYTQARSAIPAIVKGSIIYLDPAWKMLFVQDDTGGIYVHHVDTFKDLAVGDLVVAEGVTGAGEYTPVLATTVLRKVGRGSLPIPMRPQLADLKKGRYDSQFIEMKGIVRAAVNWQSHLQLTVISEFGEFTAYVPKTATNNHPSTFVDTSVQLRGVCGVLLNSKKQPIGIQLFIPDESQIIVLQTGPSDPFSKPVIKISQILSRRLEDYGVHRQHIQGVLVYYEPGKRLFVTDGSGFMQVFSPERGALELGDQLDIVGFVSQGDYSRALENATLIKIGSETPPAPKKWSAAQISLNLPDSELVTVEGTLLDHASDENGQIWTLQDQYVIFQVHYRGNLPSTRSLVLKGSVLKASGICTIRVDELRRPVSFGVQLRSLGGLEVLKSPPWWSLQHTVVVLGICAVAALAGVFWVFSLKRQVRAQTELIRAKLKSEAALEVRYRSLFNQAREMVFSIDAEGRLLEVNRAAQGLFGLSFDNLLGKNLKEFLPDPGPELWSKMVSPQKNLQIEIVGKSRRTMIEINSYLLVEDEKPGGIQILARDVTQRHAAEIALKRSEEQYRSVIEHSLQGLMIHQHETICFVNPAFLQIFGFDNPDQLIGTSIWELVCDEARPTLEGRNRRTLSGETLPAHTGWKARRKDGGIIWVESAGVRIAWHDNPAILAAFINITERKTAEAEAQKLAAFPQMNPNPVFEFNTVGDLTYCNQAAVEMAHRLGHLNVFEILPAETARLVKQSLESGSSSLNFLTVLAERTLSWSFFPIAQSRVVHCYADDITEKINLEEQLRQSQKMESVGQLAAGIAHDFNNLLTVIQGHSSLVLHHDTFHHDTRTSVEQIKIAAERAADLTRQLLTFSRKQVMKVQGINLNDLVHDVVKMLARVLGDEIVIQTQLTAESSWISGDFGMMEQLIMNLAVNARDAMPNGGTVAISLKKTVSAPPPVEGQKLVPKSKFICLSVEDTGTGISPEHLPRIFEPFFTTKDVGKGTGLGLATVYGIVNQHHGWIDVASTVGSGTAFKVFIPEECSLSPVAATAVPAKPVKAGSETVMVVEDEPALRRLVCNILKNYGYKVVQAASSKEALELWPTLESRAELLLTDVTMPFGISGIELAEILKKQHPELKIIFTTGYSLELNGRNIGPHEDYFFLPKPYPPNRLTELVRMALDQSKGNINGKTSLKKAQVY